MGHAMRGRMGREGEIEVAAGVSSFAFVIFQGERCQGCVKRHFA